ncbi:hypothetical protein [Nocardioides faecalis]|nr:hypothetical protein [Nocardioides faecalis]
MSWHTTTVPREGLARLIADIRRQGGTVGSCRRCPAGLLVTWFKL